MGSLDHTYGSTEEQHATQGQVQEINQFMESLSICFNPLYFGRSALDACAPIGIFESPEDMDPV